MAELLVQLDQEQRQAIYRRLVQLGLEKYQREVEEVAMGTASPTMVLNLLGCAVEEAVNRERTRLMAVQNELLRRLNSPLEAKFDAMAH